MTRFFNVYQYLGPALLFPASYYLWLKTLQDEHRLVWLVLSVPIVFAYVIPGLGTNYFKLWELKTKIRLGRFRPHHGFVFGTAASLLAWITLPAQSSGLVGLESIRAGFVLGSVLAFWNWLYDISAIRSGFIVVYTQASHERLGPEAVATEYAPVLFGTFGFCYGLMIWLGRYELLQLGHHEKYWWFIVVGNLAGVVVPLLSFVLCSYLKRGVSGLTPYHGG
ncbi:MAG: hypothetical protein AB1898_04015 [Acidobacteriota bacterium]